MVYAFGGLVLDLDCRELRRGNVQVELEPQVFDVLVYLLQHRERVVDKDELFAAIWKGRTVSDSALASRINAVRRAVGDDGHAQRVIRTVPRHGFRFVAEVEELPAGQQAEPSAAKIHLASPAPIDRPSITVMPFTAIGADPAERGVAAALVENVLVALSRFQWLSVVAYSSGLAANAGYLVQGSVYRCGLRLRVTARLLEAITAAHLWTERFDGAVANAFDLLDQAAATIAGSIDPTLQLAEARRLEACASREASAFELHLRAQPILSIARTNILRSLGLVRQAIAVDPTYAPALADAAYCLQILDLNGWVAGRRSNQQEAVDYARRALQFACDVEPVATAAHVLAYFGEDTDGALALGEQAVTLNSNFARGWFSHGMTRLYAGRLDEAVASFETSLRLSPQDRAGRRNIAAIGIAHLFNRRFDEAIPRLRLTVQEFPHWATPYGALASCYAHLGHQREAEAIAARLKAVDPSLAPTSVQFQNTRHRELLAPGLKLAKG